MTALKVAGTLVFLCAALWTTDAAGPARRLDEVAARLVTLRTGR